MTYGLIGKTLGHSFSKIVHEALSDYAYSLYPLPTEEEFDRFMTERKFPGINVTIPYKTDVIPYCEELDEKAKAIGAINTIVNRDGKLYGYNTDYDGFVYLSEKIGISFENKVVLILGTGGTFKTVFAVANDKKAKEILVASRTPDRENPQGYTALTYEEALQRSDVEIIVNTSPVGMYPNNEGIPLSLEGFGNLKGVVDVVYNPFKSCLVQEAEKRGIPASGGLIMLVAQAKFAAEHFKGSVISDQAMDQVVADIAAKQSNVVLIGMPSCGKSTIGQRLALDMERKFVDLDTEIEKEAGMTIPELFSSQGEEVFRSLETKICKQFAKENGLVISTGGGIVTRTENIESLLQNGVLLYIKRPLEQLISGQNRPLSSSAEAIAQLFETRQPLYQGACHREIDNDDTLSMVIKRVEEAYYEVFST